jgi:hypothetical protein
MMKMNITLLAFIISLIGIITPSIAQNIPGIYWHKENQIIEVSLTKKSPSKNARSGYTPINLKTIPNHTLTDKDPKLLTIKIFGQRESAQPEGLRSESLEVSYPKANTAIIIFTIDGLADDSIDAQKYRIEMELVAGKWKIIWAGTKVKCKPNRGHSNWSSQRCS